MIHTGRHFLQIPGPTNIPDRVLRAIGQPIIDHRGAEFAKLGSVFFAGVLGHTLGGFISDRIFDKTGDRKKARRNLVVAGFVCSVASMLPIPLLHNLTWVAVFLSLAFFFSVFS